MAHRVRAKQTHVSPQLRAGQSGTRLILVKNCVDSLVRLDGAICLIHSPSYRGHRRAGAETAKDATVTATARADGISLYIANANCLYSA